MRITLLSLVFLAACDSGSVKLDHRRADPAADDTGTPAADDTGAPSGETGETGDSTETGAETAEEPAPDYALWRGSRRFTAESDYWDCDEETNEFGEELTDGDELDAMRDACPSCERFYEVGVSPDEVCDYVGLADPAYRGLVLGDGWAAVYSFSFESWDDEVEATLLDSEADFDGWTITYDYEVDFYSTELAVAGVVTFPEVDG